MTATAASLTPATFDIATVGHLEIPELEELRDQVEDLIHRKRQEYAAALLEDLRKKADYAGLNLHQLATELAPTATLPKRKLQPIARYRNPDDHAETWSGRGKKPRWLREALEAGHDLVEFEIGGVK